MGEYTWILTNLIFKKNRPQLGALEYIAGIGMVASIAAGVVIYRMLEELLPPLGQNPKNLLDYRKSTIDNH